MGLPEETNRKLLKFIKIGGSNDEILAALEALAIENENYQNGFSELKTVISQAANLGINSANIQIDLSITRGLDYYTGTVYETFLTNIPNLVRYVPAGVMRIFPASLWIKSFRVSAFPSD